MVRDQGEAGGMSEHPTNQGEPLEPEGVVVSETWPDSANWIDSFQAILDGPRVGEVDGVLFDFRHDKLPSAELWHSPDGASPFGIAFPWDRALWGGDAEAAARHVTNGASERGWAVTHVHAGDRVSVERVVPFSRGAGQPPYVDAHDAHSLAAYLIVTRLDGTTEQIADPINFNARDAMGPASPHFYAGDDGRDEWVGDFRVTYDKVSRRLNRLNQTKGREAYEWALLANEAQEGVDDEREAFAAALGGVNDDPFSPDLARLIDLATTVGYALAKAESAPFMDKVRARTRPATQARRAITDPVREAAKMDILAYPKTPQTACARRVALKLGRDQRSVEKLIAQMFEAVTLPGGAKEKRPRRLYTNPPSNRRMDGVVVDLTLPLAAETSHS